MHAGTELRVGFAGLGRMGTPMAARLAAAGLLVGVYNRTTEKAEAFAASYGVAACASAVELAARCNIVIAMMADEDASLALFSGAGGVLAGLEPGSIVVEMATVGLDHVSRLAGLVGERGGTLVDAPVSGSVAMAAAGGLSILAGGDSAAIERIQPALAAMGARTFELGELGAGTCMKLAVNTVVYALNQGVSEGLVLAERLGIPRASAYEVFASSAVSAPFVEHRRGLFERPGSGEPALSLHLAAKDLELIIALATSVGLDLPQASTDLAVLKRAVSEGLADEDVSAVAELLRRSDNHAAAAGIDGTSPVRT